MSSGRPPPPPPPKRFSVPPPAVRNKKEPLEKKVEEYFRTEIVKLGGKSYKFSSPNNRGVPDRVALLENTVFFCELKRVSGKATDLQLRVMRDFTSKGGLCCIIYGHSGVDAFLAAVISGVIDWDGTREFK